MAQTRKCLRGAERSQLRRLVRKASRDQSLRVWKRAKAVLAYYEGQSVSEIMEAWELGRRTLYDCLERYRQEGVTGLLEGDHPGRTPRLTEENKLRLCDILDSGPVAYGRDTGIWTAPAIAQVITAEFDVRYHSHHVCKLLHQLGFSVQRPTRQLAAADPRRQREWVRTTYPALKKGQRKQARP